MVIQLSLFSEKEMFPKLIAEYRQEEREIKASFEMKYMPSVEEFESYDNCIDKNILWNFNKTKSGENRNTNAHSMLVKTLCEFTQKSEEQLVESDLLIFYKTINNEASADKLRRCCGRWGVIETFKQSYALSRFGTSQYELLENVVKNALNYQM